MYRSVWNTFKESVCSLNFYNSRNILFFRSSGFRYDNYIISALYKEEMDRADYVIIGFPPNEPEGYNKSLRIPVDELCNRLPRDLEKGLPGLLALPVKPDEFKPVPSVKTNGSLPDAGIGTPVAMLSYSHKMNELYMKTGLISSHLTVRDEDFIFVEASFEQGNSGAPLINAFTGEVIGVMVDCFSSPYNNHKKIKRIINENIRMLNDAGGKWTLGNIDPVQVLIANQHMINYLAKEIYLHAQRNYGFAVPLEKVSRYLINLNHTSRIAVSDKAEI